MWLELMGKLSFAGMALWTVLALVGVAAGSITGRPGWARLLLRTTGAALGLYFVVLLGLSLTSHERVIPRGSELPVCGLDCDLFLSVADVDAMPLVAEAQSDVLWKVQLRARSDARRVNMSLDGVRVELMDATGRYGSPRVSAGADHAYRLRGSGSGRRRGLRPCGGRGLGPHLWLGPGGWRRGDLARRRLLRLLLHRVVPRGRFVPGFTGENVPACADRRACATVGRGGVAKA